MACTIGLLVLCSIAAGSSGHDQQHIAEKVASPPVIIDLHRDTEPLKHNGGLKNFYSADMLVGSPEPQHFRVGFDLSGSTSIVPSKDCQQKACNKRQLYDKWHSESAEDVQSDGKLVIPGRKKVPRRKGFLTRRDWGTQDFATVDFGEGRVRGRFLRDKVCIVPNDSDGEPRCFPMGFLAASIMTDHPFLEEPYDGIIGLGVDSGPLSKDFNFLSSFGQTVTGQMSGIFGLYLRGKSGAELALGGYDQQRLNSPISWAPIFDDGEGRWQVSISAIRLGNSTLDLCTSGKCRAALDYSTSVFSIPSSMGATFENALSAARPNVCHDSAMPELQLTLATMTLTVPLWDHMPGFQSNNSPCTPELVTHNLGKNTPADENLLILGESVLQRYYTIYDIDAKRVGFSLAAAAEAAPPPKKNKLDDEITEAAPLVKQESQVILLVQVKVVASKTRSSLGVEDFDY